MTLKTSGTTASPKRIFFTKEDLELTVDYFAHAMTDFVRPGQKVIIFMPGRQPESIGDLLRKALGRIGVLGIAAGPVTNPAEARKLITRHNPDCLIGIPTQMLLLVRDTSIPKIPGNNIKHVILSADHAPAAPY